MRLMRFEGGEHVIVHDVGRGDWRFVGAEAAPGITAVTIDDGLHVDLADALEMAGEKGVDGGAFHTPEQQGFDPRPLIA